MQGVEFDVHVARAVVGVGDEGGFKGIQRTVYHQVAFVRLACLGFAGRQADLDYVLLTLVLHTLQIFNHNVFLFNQFFYFPLENNETCIIFDENI